MRFKLALSDHQGFTLVELMVVVAIIGLLSSVAIPRFKKYQAKSKMVEAKLQLSAVYTAQAAFYSEYNMYAQCLRYMGYDPDPQRDSRYYAIGIFSTINTRDSNAHTTALNTGLDATSCPDSGSAVDGTSNTTADATFFYAGKGAGSAIVNGTSVDPTANLAGAAGDCVDSGDGSVGTTVAPGGCIGTQADADHTVFIVAAIGVISASAATAEKASGLTIDSGKNLRIVVPGY